MVFREKDPVVGVRDRDRSGTGQKPAVDVNFEKSTPLTSPPAAARH